MHQYLKTVIRPTIERRKDGKLGFYIGARFVSLTINGEIWFIRFQLGRLFDFTIWEKDC